jgi:hypothetical protein
MRDDDASDIRALLKTEAEGTPRPAGMSWENLRRARVQRMAVAFAWMFAVVVVVAGVAFAATWVISERDPIRPASDGWVAIADVEQLQNESVVYDPSHRAFAVWNQGQPLVLSALVPHIPGQEERALFCTTSQQFGGPHGEKFDVRGYYHGGPARHGLDRYESRVEDGVVRFDPQELIQGPARGEGPALEPAGRFCTEDHTEREPGFAATADGNPALDSEFRFEPYPGNTWYGPDGRVAAESPVINVIRGPEHCGWDSAALLHVGWPLGHADATESRQFVRDTQHVLPQDSLMSEFDDNAELFGLSRYTGFRTDFMELWLFPEDDSGIFLMFADHVEWWPRAEEPIACD